MESVSSRVSFKSDALVIFVGMFMWLAHFTAPSDMHDDDQLKPAAYVLDIVKNQHWAVQSDFEGSVASKPPLYQWTCALVALIRGSVDDWAMYIPSGLALISTAVLISRVTRTRFGERAGIWSGLSFLLCSLTAKHLCLARTDAMFTCWVTAAAIAASRAWELGGTRRWTLFWFFAALATLTKGPLGLLLAGLGLVGLAGERRTGEQAPRRGNHLPGVAIYILCCGGWFLWAYLTDGDRVIDKMIGRELIGHAITAESGNPPFARIYQPWLYFLARFAPWCLPALIGAFLAWKRPSHTLESRRFERFCASWLVLGLVIFGIPGHQRADLLLPLFPAAAVLCGIRIAAWGEHSSERAKRIGPAFAGAIAIVGAIWWNHFGRLHDVELQQSREAARFASAVGGATRSAIFTPDAVGLQYEFGTKQPPTSTDAAIEALLNQPGIVVVSEVRERIEALASNRGIRTRELSRFVFPGTDREFVACEKTR